MLKLFFQNYHIKRILIVLGIILSIFLFKTVIDYLNYELETEYALKFPGFGPKCLEYVTIKKPNFKEFQESEYQDEYTYIFLDNKDTYIACFEDIMYYDYPSFWHLNSQEIKKYSLNDALKNGFLTSKELVKTFKDYFKDITETRNYEITDFYIYDE